MNPSPEPLKSTRHRPLAVSLEHAHVRLSRQLSGMMSPIAGLDLLEFALFLPGRSAVPALRRRLTAEEKQSEPCRNDAQHVLPPVVLSESQRLRGENVQRAGQCCAPVKPSGLELDIPVKVNPSSFRAGSSAGQPAVVVEVCYARVEGFSGAPHILASAGISPPLPQIAGRTGGDDVFPGGSAAGSGARDHVDRMSDPSVVPQYWH